MATPGRAKQELKKRIQDFIADAKFRFLDLSNLDLVEIPALEELFPARAQLPTPLDVLDISHNRISQLPRWITSLSTLSSLIASHNRISSLPDSIEAVRTLEYLDLRNNIIWQLPHSMRHMTNLQQLYLHNNHLNIPSEVLGAEPSFDAFYRQGYPPPKPLKRGASPTEHNAYLKKHLPKITSLDLRNLASHLHEALSRETLKTALDWERKNTQASDPARILSYYFRVMVAKRPLNEAKLILVGFGEVGKTSLVNRLVHNWFNRGEAKTEGIAITQWPIRLNTNEDVRLHVWDFGGQEILHATHQFFLTARSLYLLVLSGRQGREDSDVEYWLSLTEGLGGQSPVIVVLNKVREHPFTINRNGLLAKYPLIRGFVETDCDDGYGIDELRTAIFRAIDGLEHLRDAFPSAWFDIKNRIAGMEENYLTFDQFRNICSQLGEDDRKAHEDLALYLHTLGIALNYKDDPRLRDTHVLNPHWVTKGIYELLNASVIKGRKGEMLQGDLADVLDKRDYPMERHGFLIDLMRKFELCFPFDDGDRYLIPELLDKDQPAIAKEMEATAALRFQYCYEGAVPEGLIPRFIVRTHRRSAGQPRWRTGVILQFEGSTALVKAEPSDKRVTIAICGKKDELRRLLGIIRDHFDAIHASYRQYSVREMVPVPDHPDVIIPYDELRVMEKKAVNSLPKVVGNTVIFLVVKDLLNGVEMTSMASAPALRLFYSYSHKDEKLRDELATHLSLLKRQRLILPWHDREITAGDEWKGEIGEALAQADIVLLLVSADFIASDYCYDVEMSLAMERHAKGEARVIPIILRDCAWTAAPFGTLQALPRNGTAVTAWPNRDTAWRNVEQGLEKVVTELQTRRASPL